MDKENAGPHSFNPEYKQNQHYKQNMHIKPSFTVYQDKENQKPKTLSTAEQIKNSVRDTVKHVITDKTDIKNKEKDIVKQVCSNKDKVGKPVLKEKHKDQLKAIVKTRDTHNKDDELTDSEKLIESLSDVSVRPRTIPNIPKDIENEVPKSFTKSKAARALLRDSPMVLDTSITATPPTKKKDKNGEWEVHDIFTMAEYEDDIYKYLKYSEVQVINI